MHAPRETRTEKLQNQFLKEGNNTMSGVGGNESVPVKHFVRITNQTIRV